MVWHLNRPSQVYGYLPAKFSRPLASVAKDEIQNPKEFSQPIASSVATTKVLDHDALLALVLVKLQDLENDDNSDLRPQRLQELETLLRGTNMLRIVQELPTELMGYAFALPSLREKLMSDPQAALEWMGSHTNVYQSQALTLVHDWGQKDRDGLQQYLVSLPEGQWKQEVMATAASEALSDDPVAAITWATQMKPGSPQVTLLTTAATDWAKNDPNAATQWADQVSDPILREQLIGSIAIGAADGDPVQAADFILNSIPSGEVLDQSIAGIVWTWARQDPVAAGAWVSQFPNGQARQLGLANLMNVWSGRNAATATEWVEGLEGSLQTEAARDLLAALPVGTPAP